MATSTVKYSATTGKALKAGEKTTDAKGNTYTGGQSYSAPSSGSSKSSAPAYNAATGSTTGKPSAEYDSYLKSLNKKGSANYIPTPEDAGEVNTAQPSPTTVQAGANLPGAPAPDTVGFDSQTGQALTPGTSTTDALGNTFTQGQKFSQALAKLKASGVGAPQDAGTGKMLAAGAVTNPPQPLSPLGGIMETDTNFDSIFTNLDKYMEPLNQKKTLLQEYKGLSKSLGIDAINEELIDAKKIIEGSEDDIRSEVTAAGGFATDSQVLALANARNKSLIKNYNVLLESRDNAMQQLNTMMNLTMEDRKAAEAEFDRKMNFTFKIAEFKERAVDNSRSQLNTVIENVGYAGLLAATSPYEQSLIEKTLGLGQGGLAQLAAYKKPLDEMEKLELENQRLQNQKLRQDLSGGGGGKIETQVVDVDGRKVLINSDTGETIKIIGEESNVLGGAKTQQQSQSKSQIDSISGLISDKGLNSAVGPNFLTRGELSLPLGIKIPLGTDTLTGAKSNFIAGVEQIKSQLTLDALIQAKAKGATFGALSEGELRALSASASKLGTWAIKDKDGNIKGYNASESDFKKELEKINNFAKEDYILKGGDPAQVGVQVMPDGTHWIKNSDGSMTQL